MTISVAEAQAGSPKRDESIVPEIWARTPKGDYLKVAATSHYEKVLDGEVIYWMPDTRDFMAYSLKKRSGRKLPGYKVPPYQDTTRGVSLSNDRKGLELGEKVNGQWRYTPIDLDSSKLK